MTMGKRIRQRRALLTLSQGDLAEGLGVDQSTVAKWESGPNTPRHKTLRALAERLEVSVAWLFSGDEAMLVRGADSTRHGFEESARTRLPPVTRGERDLPVFGVAVGGDDAVFDYNGEVHEFIERPSQLEGVHNAYALYVLGESMAPRYIEGEIVYINPNRPVTHNCFVAIELKGVEDGPGKGMIKQFLKRTPSKLVLHQFNPDKTLEFAIDEIKHWHRIVQSGEA